MSLPSYSMAKKAFIRLTQQKFANKDMRVQAIKNAIATAKIVQTDFEKCGWQESADKMERVKTLLIELQHKLTSGVIKKVAEFREDMEKVVLALGDAEPSDEQSFSQLDKMNPADFKIEETKLSMPKNVAALQRCNVLFMLKSTPKGMVKRGFDQMEAEYFGDTNVALVRNMPVITVKVEKRSVADIEAQIPDFLQVFKKQETVPLYLFAATKGGCYIVPCVLPKYKALFTRAAMNAIVSAEYYCKF